MRSSVLEAERGAGDDVLDRVGDEDLAPCSVRHHACGEMDGDSPQGSALLDNFAHVYACARPEAEVLGRRLDALCRPNSVDRSFEGSHEFVAGMVDQAAAVC